MSRRCRPQNTSHLSRRKLLELLSAGASIPALHPFSAVFGGLIASASHEAAAQSKDGPRNYVMVYLESGPPRWHFDLPLHPYEGADKIIRNAGLNNGFQGGMPAYLTTPIQAGGETLNMPKLWGASLPRPNGQPAAAMAELASNMMIIRGYDMQSDGHANNRMKQVMPLAGAGSLNGLVADKSPRPLPAVTVAGGLMDDAYSSPQGVGQLKWFPEDAARNPLMQFLDPFQYDAATKAAATFGKRENLDELIEAALGKMQAAAEKRMPGTTGIFRDRASARKLLKRTFGDLPGIYGALVGKYAGIVAACKALDVPGVNDLPVGAGLPGEFRRATPNGQATAVVIENADLREIFKAETAIQSIAEGFAVAEFMIGEGLGSAVLLAVNQMVNTNMIVAGQPVNALYVSDDHAGGTAISTLAWAYFYRSVAACIYELRAVFKAKNVWDRTVIQVCSEFSRAPRVDGTGSDHGYEGNVMSLYSGAIKAPLVIGNVTANSSASLAAVPAYAGTWGGAAPIEHDKTTANLNIGHVSSTVAALLEVERPMKNFAPLVSVDDGGVKSLVEKAKNV